MKKYLSILLVITALLLNACSNRQKTGSGNVVPKEQNMTINYVLPPVEFQKKMEEFSLAPVVDVRTPKEFDGGHIAKAINIDFYNVDFYEQMNEFGKTKPIFIYCLVGGRSTSVLDSMRSLGFTDVYELSGGMLKWRLADMPEIEVSRTISTGMTKAQYNELLNTKELVLINFYAEWCPPCKRMAPYMEELKKELADKVTIIRIDVDKNTAIIKELKVDGLPKLFLYKDKVNTWSNTGFISKEDLLTHLKQGF